MTVLANLCGFPAVSVPVDRGSMQLMGPLFDDYNVLQTALLLESNTESFI